MSTRNELETLTAQAKEAVIHHIESRKLIGLSLEEAVCNFVNNWEFLDGSTYGYQVMTMDLLSLLTKPEVSSQLAKRSQDGVGEFLTRLAFFVENLKDPYVEPELERALLDNSIAEEGYLKDLIQKYSSKQSALN